MGEDRKVIIYVWVRQMSQPLSSSLWQSRALIHLLADCRQRRGKKKRSQSSFIKKLGARESTKGGGFHIHPALLSLICPTSQPDSYEGKK